MSAELKKKIDQEVRKAVRPFMGRSLTSATRKRILRKVGTVLDRHKVHPEEKKMFLDSLQVSWINNVTANKIKLRRKQRIEKFKNFLFPWRWSKLWEKEQAA